MNLFPPPNEALHIPTHNAYDSVLFAWLIIPSLKLKVPPGVSQNSDIHNTIQMQAKNEESRVSWRLF